jgi:pimeloyl-ACP methyl ester carboxylesterase
MPWIAISDYRLAIGVSRFAIRRLMPVLGITLVCVIAPVVDARQIEQAEVAGHWEGAVALGGQDLDVLLDIQGSNADLHGTISILESRLEAFPLPRIGTNAGELTFEIPPGWGLAMFAGLGLPPDQEVIGYQGRLMGPGIEGRLTVGKSTFPLALHRGHASVPYREEDVSFSSGEVTLAGTLLIPPTTGRHPAVVFTHGSGSNTRDAHRYEADLLVRRGVACLLYDKRGAGHSTGASWEWASFDELAADGEQAVRYLTTRTDIDPHRIGLYGLSQGAWLIEIAAARSRNVAFLVAAAGGGVPVWQQELYYRANQMRDQGFDEEAVQNAVAFLRMRFDAARTGLGWDRVEAAMKGFSDSGVKWFPRFTGNQDTMAAARLWWLLAFSYDPARDLKHIRVPVLGLFAQDDRVMPTAATIRGLQSGLAAAGNRNLTIRTIPGAYHSMMVRQDLGGVPLRRVISADYTAALVRWVVSQAGETR